ncbi:MAG: TetR/AcrR family transcriptional regulator [Bacteroidetes bacterium]|nr:TetR/AcrR family transcriptional regulator [Bacteroidota bacterium]MBL0015649.1 TetR/AcrR family transcriptional regulator [Bacteroidota bacterium]
MEKNPTPITRQRILDRCFVAFNQKGFFAVSVDSIAKDLKISKKTIYKHCSSKEEMVEENLVQLFARFEEKLSKSKKQANSKSQLQDFFEILKTWRMSISTILKTDLANHLPHLFERIENFERQVLLRQLTAGLKEMRAEGEIDFPSPSREFSAVLLQVMKSLSDVHAPQAEFMLSTILRGMSMKKKKKDK